MHTLPHSSRTGGMSLVEVIVFVTIASIILIVLVSLSITVTRQSLVSQHKIYATRYADELAEWLRVQKELGWQNFYDKSQLATANVYCVNRDIELTDDLTSLLQSPIGANVCKSTAWYIPPPSAPPEPLPPEPRIFARYVIFDEQDNNTKSVKATITVSWQEAGGTPFETHIETLFAPR